MRRLAIALLLLLAAAAGTSLAGLGPFVVNREGEYRLVLFFSTPSVVTEPGLRLVPAPLAPGIGSLEVIDARWRHLASEAREVATSDQERIVLDSFVIWRVEDPLVYWRQFKAQDAEAEVQINQQVASALRAVVGKHTLVEVLGKGRGALLGEVAARARERAAQLGIELGDVRINRTELPRGTEENVNARMRSERERLGRRYRAEGEADARRIRAEADREATLIVSEARGQAEAERGLGQAEAIRLVAGAAALDPEFYDYVRTLDAYRRTLGERTTLVLPPSHAFLRELQSGGEKR
jgi:membrane protease subunit HflC